MHWTLSLSVSPRCFPFSSFGMVAFCVGCGVVPHMFRQAKSPGLYVHALLAWVSDSLWLTRPHARPLFNQLPRDSYPAT